MENILKYIPTILIVIAVIALIAALVSKWIKSTPEKRRDLINNILYALAVEAERLYGSKTGQAKKMQVIAWFYERYKWLGLFLPESVLSEWIDEAVAKLNEWMKSNPVGAKNLIGEI